MAKMRLLVIDDDAVTRRAVMNCFAEDRTAEVIPCTSGQEALDQLRNGQQVDRLIVDWNMPRMTGYEFVRAVRADARFKEVPILMLTCETSIGHVRSALEAGADEYLMKPFTKEMLLGKLALLAQD